MALPEQEFTPATLSELDGLRLLHIGSDWIHGAMCIADPLKIECEYAERMCGWLLWRDAGAADRGHAIQFGLGVGTLTRYTHGVLRMKTTAVEINPHVIAACRESFDLPADDDLLSVILADAGDWARHAAPGQAQALNVDVYGEDTSAPALDDDAFYADCRALLADGGLMTVNLIYAHPGHARSVERIARVFGADQVWMLDAPEDSNCAGNAVVVAGRGVVLPGRDVLEQRAREIEDRHGLPACDWLGLIRPVLPEAAALAD